MCVQAPSHTETPWSSRCLRNNVYGHQFDWVNVTDRSALPCDMAAYVIEGGNRQPNTQDLPTATENL